MFIINGNILITTRSITANLPLPWIYTGILLGNFLPEKSPKTAASLPTSCQQMTQLLQQAIQLQAPGNIQFKMFY